MKLARTPALCVAAALVAGLPARADEAERTDAEVAEAIEDALVHDPAVRASEVHVEVDETVATLRGRVSNLLAKDRADLVAEGVRGVSRVVNALEVVPAVRADQEIEADIRVALRLDPTTDAFDFDVDVDGGVLAIGGDVGTRREAVLALELAKGVNGVRAIEDRIEVSYGADAEDPADRALEEQVETNLSWDALVQHEHVDVDAEDGVVHLAGTVGSSLARQRAIMNAHVSGVVSVNARELSIAPWARADDEQPLGIEPDRPDAHVRDAIVRALQYDPRVDVGEVTVEVDDGAVALTGTVGDLRAKRAAAQDADEIVGVEAVDDGLVVRRGPPDDELEQRIQRSFRRDVYLSAAPVSVRVDEGVATLRGTVEQGFVKDRAEDLAAATTGIGAVVNEVEVAEG